MTIDEKDRCSYCGHIRRFHTRGSGLCRVWNREPGGFCGCRIFEDDAAREAAS